MHTPPQHTRTDVNACGAARAAHLRLRARQRRRGHRGGEQRVYAAGRQRARARDRLGRRARPRAAVEAPRVGARPPQRLQLRRGGHQRGHAFHRALQHGLRAHHGSGSAGSGTRCWTSGRVVVHARALVATGVAAAESHQARPMHSQPPGCAARRRRPASAALPPGSACGAGWQRFGRARPCACDGARTAPRPPGGARRRRGGGRAPAGRRRRWTRRRRASPPWRPPRRAPARAPAAAAATGRGAGPAGRAAPRASAARTRCRTALRTEG